jgi:hypothetical protein
VGNEERARSAVDGVGSRRSLAVVVTAEAEIEHLN